MPGAGKKINVFEALKVCRLEDALVVLRQEPDRIPLSRIGLLIDELQSRARDLLAAGEVGACRRLKRQIYALDKLREHGPQPETMIREVELEGDYDGKILLVSLAGGLLKQKTCLRSGDAWHREILRNTIAEIRDLGFTGTRVYPLGGGFLRFETRRRLLLWGTSDEFGRCDMGLAAQLLRRAFPETEILVGD
jgi:hypothetical protein